MSGYRSGRHLRGRAHPLSLEALQEEAGGPGWGGGGAGGGAGQGATGGGCGGGPGHALRPGHAPSPLHYLCQPRGQGGRVTTW